MYILQHGKLNSQKTLLVILYNCMYIINKFIRTESDSWFSETRQVEGSCGSAASKFVLSLSGVKYILNVSRAGKTLRLSVNYTR